MSRKISIFDLSEEIDEAKALEKIRPRAPGIYTIFCDESGATGNNLLDAKQPYFAYAAVAIEPEEAADLMDHLASNVDIRGDEIKSTNLLSSVDRRKALADTVRHVAGRSKVFVADKKFALSCKFFEYVFEPILAERNSFFYQLGFHKFIANLLYVHLVVRDASAEEILETFQGFMRSRDEAQIRNLLEIKVDGKVNPLRDLIEIASAYHDRVAKELSSLGNGSLVGKWVLDLTTSALFQLLAAWGNEYEMLDVYCDASKPLESDPSLFATMIGRSERAFMTFEDRVASIAFNLAGPLKFVNSKTHPGIQVADLVVGASLYVQHDNNRDIDLIRDAMGDVVMMPIAPEPNLIDLNEKGPFLNAALLWELKERARAGDDPLTGLLEAALHADYAYDFKHDRKRTRLRRPRPKRRR